MAPDLSQLTVVPVDDEIFLAKPLMFQLRTLGYSSPDYATNAAETVRLVEQYKPDLLIMDIRLGKDDGIDLAVEMRQKHGIPSIFMTAFDTEETRLRAKKARPIGYIAKAAPQEELHRELQEALPDLISWNAADQCSDDRTGTLLPDNTAFSVNWGECDSTRRGIYLSRTDARNAIDEIETDLADDPFGKSELWGSRTNRRMMRGPVVVEFNIFATDHIVEITRLMLAPKHNDVS